MKKLDKSKPYGTISGDTEGRIYEQDNTFFHGDGTEWTPPAKAEAKPAAKPLTDDEKPKAETKPVPASAGREPNGKPKAKAPKAPTKPVAAVSPSDAQVKAQLQG